MSETYTQEGANGTKRTRNRINYGISAVTTSVPVPLKTPMSRLSAALRDMSPGNSVGLTGYSIPVVRRIAKEVWHDKHFVIDTDDEGALRIWRTPS